VPSHLHEILIEQSRARLEEPMDVTTYEPQSEFLRGWISRNEAKGQAGALLTILDTRGIEVPVGIRAGILGCTDRARLDTLIRGPPSPTRSRIWTTRRPADPSGADDPRRRPHTPDVWHVGLL
jgi:hypothetical protein